jgi:hypothetical protein
MWLSRVSTYYILPAMLYSGARKVVLTHDAKYKTPVYDDVTKTVVVRETPLLMTDRALITFLGFGMGAYLFPFHFINDMRCAEIHMRGLEKKDYLVEGGDDNSTTATFISYVLE